MRCGRIWGSARREETVGSVKRLEDAPQGEHLALLIFEGELAALLLTEIGARFRLNFLLARVGCCCKQ